VVFQVVDSPAGVQVSLDGQPLAAGELGVALPVDSGKHAVEAKAPDRVDWRGAFELGKTDEGKTRSLPVGPLSPIQRVEKIEKIEPPVGPATPERPAGPGAPAEPTTRTPPLKWVGLATAGAGVVAVTVGTIFALSARSTWNDAKAMGCDNNGVCKDPAAVNLVNDAGSKATIATIGITAGAVLVAGGAALWFLTPSSETVTPTVSVGPGGAQLGVKGSF
jgi:hypothetical protein